MIIRHNKSTGFTLAETLIALVIIGIIAALTIPNLIYTTNKSTYVTQLKESYSELQQAFGLLQLDNGGSIVPVFSNDTTTNFGNGSAMNTFLTKLNYIKNCGSSTGCWENGPRYFTGGTQENSNLDGYINGSYEKALLANGSSLSIGMYSTNCTANQGSGPLNNVCAFIEVDINGPKGPNTIGRDDFPFWITQTGIYPYGNYGDGFSCDQSSASWYTSFGCTYKVLSENGMNY